MPAEPVSSLKLVSVLLEYPSVARVQAAAAVPELAIAPARRDQGGRLRRFCAWYAGTPLGELERRYVEAFDFAKGSSLHLTYHVHGDRRQRGLALVRLKEAYRDAGLEPPAAELPDYLPLMLEFAAIAPAGRGGALLEDHRVAIELVRGSLARERSPFTPLLDAIVTSLPRLSANKLAKVRRLAIDGPPHEEVGLEPFAPPEVMPALDAEAP